uniref:Transferrin-like domain-containing protein n=1 Tax=Panagrellus redivivus TaxID=6233 RepID=A0A7E4ZSU9_PANRE
MPVPELTKTNCQEQVVRYVERTEDCFLVSWSNNRNQSYCAAYNGMMGDNKFDNCNLHTSKSTYRAYGSIENFKPYDGKVLFKEQHSQPIVAIREIQNEGALYALRKDHNVVRLLIGDEKTSEVLRSIPGTPGKQLLEVLPKSNRVLYVPASSPTTINAFTSSCGGMYETCTSIAWKDPLHCLFCADKDGTGTVVPDKTKCPNKVTYSNVCPPTIFGTTVTSEQH